MDGPTGPHDSDDADPMGICTCTRSARVDEAPECEPDDIETARHVVVAYQQRLGLGVSVEGDVVYDVGECVVRRWRLG